MPITFAPSFQELLFRVLSSCLQGLAMPRTYRRDQIRDWCRRRLERRPP